MDTPRQDGPGEARELRMDQLYSVLQLCSPRVPLESLLRCMARLAASSIELKGVVSAVSYAATANTAATVAGRICSVHHIVVHHAYLTM
jgi:hypothetical protein